MKPVERNGYIEVWIVVKLMNTGQFYMDTTHISEFGSGYFTTELAAQHHQTILTLKGERCQVYKLEWPL